MMEIFFLFLNQLIHFVILKEDAGKQGSENHPTNGCQHKADYSGNDFVSVSHGSAS
jgi:hypothetical protein